VRNFFKVGLIVFALAIFLVPVVASAALKLPYWGPLAVKCEGNICISLCQLLLLAENLINFGLTILLFAIAPILLTWGGFVILTAGGSSERLGSGRKILMGTVVGVAIALGAYLIIGTFLWGLGIVAGEGQGKINWPNVSCSAGEPPVVDEPIIPVVPIIPDAPDGGNLADLPSLLSHEQAKFLLDQYHISISSTNGCSDVDDAKCTSLDGFPKEGVVALIGMKAQCSNCNIIITAGTEVGHQTHGYGKAIVDLRDEASLNNYIYSLIGTNSPVINNRYRGTDGSLYTFENNIRNGQVVDGHHWHVILL
jgi:hypothetical protein